MSSEKIASAVNILKGNLAAGWDIISGSQGQYQDLGIARRFGGSAAAYSLRDIGAMNGRVVKVRRDGDDVEEDFSANQVQSGSLENWVNGKLENTLPADVATAAAAFSLRKVKASYASNAVRIRRSSDDAEVNVAFDSDDKVSTSSAISVVSGSTSATTLGDFLNPTYTVGTSVESASRTFNSFTANGNTGFTATKTGGGSSTGGFPYTFATGDVISVSFDLVIADSASPTFVLSGNNMGSGSLGTGTTFTSSGSYTQELTATSGTGTHLAFTDGNTGTFTVSNFKVTSHKAEAFVHTWYDQAGSNNAVQATDANQPKIASSGALLADGLDFDGTNDELRTSTNIASSQPVTVMSVTKPDAVNKRIFESITNTVRSFYGSSSETGLNAGATLLSSTNAISINNEYLQTHLFNTTSSKVFLNATESASGDGGSNAFAGNFSIGGSSALYDGTIKEVIIYTSDQSNNRFRIESNINNYYGLYNDANETSATEFSFLNQRSGGVTVSNGVSGLTLDVETASAFAGFQLKEKVIVDDIIYLSFNADLTGGSGGTASPKVALRETSISSTVRSNEFSITEGFNTVELTSTNANAEYLAFSEGDDNRIFTISDLKVSRIERNGFVPTWYDQSSNGNNAVQATAGDQPSIVLNGGLSSDGIEFDGSNDEMDLTSALGATTVQSIFAVQKNDITSGGSLLFDNRDANDDGSALFATDSAGNKQASWDAADAEHTATTNEELIGLIKTSSAITIRANGTQSDSTASSSTIDISTVPKIGQGSSGASGTNYDGSIKEIICFNTDVSSDVSDIENDINNHYNIY